MARKLTRSDFLKATGGTFGGLCLFGLTACGSGGSSSGSTALRMTWSGSDERHERTQAAIKAAVNKLQDIEIRGEPAAGGGEYFNRLATQISGGNAPDIFEANTNQFPPFASRGALIDLEQFVPDIINLDEWREDSIDALRTDEGLIGLPAGENTFMLIYSVSAFEAAGVEEPSLDWTWDDFVRTANDISSASGDDFYGTEDASSWNERFEVFIRQRGKEQFTESGELGFDREDLTAWLELWEELRESGAAVPAEVQTLYQGDLSDTPLITGRAAMQFDYANRLAAFRELTDDELGYVSYPNGPSGSSPGMFIKPGLTRHGFSGAENPEAVATVLDILVNDPEVAQHLGTDRGIPGNAEIREMVAQEASGSERDFLDYFDTVSEMELVTPMTIPRPPNVGDVMLVGSSFWRATEDAAFGRITIEEAVDRFFSEAEESLG